MRKISCGHCKKLAEAIEVNAFARYRCTSCNSVNEVLNVALKEWLGFNYDEFLSSIEIAIRKDSFDNLKANNDIELQAGYLTQSQINKLKDIFTVSFNEGLNIKEINEKIAKEVKVSDLKKYDDNGLITDKEGNPEIALNKELRTLMIARTESTRLAAEGALINYQSNDIEEVSFLASMSDRTCEECEGLNGQIMSVEDARDKIPVHVYCRCTFIPVVRT